MKILSKNGDEIMILARPDEDVARGDYLAVEDGGIRRMILQVYDETYFDSSGLVEDIARDAVIGATVEGARHDPLKIDMISHLIRDMRVLKCKIRGTVTEGMLTSDASWLPSRVGSEVRRISLSELSSHYSRFGTKLIHVGRTRSGEAFGVYAEDLDGRLNIITGRKGSGKSHLAKLLVAKLVEFGAYLIVFDLNDEYCGLSRMKDGTLSPIAGKVIQLVPGVSLRFTLRYLGLSTMMSLLRHALELPSSSLREFVKLWMLLESRGCLKMKAMYDAIQGIRCNELVREALLSRCETMMASKLFTDDDSEGMRIEDFFSLRKDGGVMIISLSRAYPLVRRMAVEAVLSKLVQLLEGDQIPPVFLFAEEAHLYLNETYWDDIVTRMRHLGIFTTLITNQPDAIEGSIYRQADSIFLFNFTSSLDLEMISRASVTDSETIKSIVRGLPQRSLLALGKIVSDMPMVVEVAPSELLTFGETKLFFGGRENTIVGKMLSAAKTFLREIC